MAKFNLVGIDGNAFSVLGYVQRAMMRVGMSNSEINDYRVDATSSDYQHLLSTSISMIDQCNEIWDNTHSLVDANDD